MELKQHQRVNSLVILSLIWLAGAVGDRLWFALDNSVPAWDQADYLTGALNYWHLLQTPQWFSGEWWTEFWMRSPKVPPLTYITTVPFLNLFGIGPDQSTLVLLFYSAILLGSVYCLGLQLFNSRVGLWAAGLCQIIPGLYRYRLDFLLDYPLTAIVTLSFCCLTFWKRTETNAKSKNSWVWALVFGLSLGLALLVKQTALFFLLTPVLWVGFRIIRQRKWGRIAQFLSSLGIATLTIYPWYRLNWLLILTSGKRATIDAAIAEGDPALNTLDAWIYYWKITPYLVSWPLLLVPLVGLIFYWWKRRQTSPVKNKQNSISFNYFPISSSPHLPIENYTTEQSVHRSSPCYNQYRNSSTNSTVQWLTVFLVGAYFLCSLNINKDARYVLPYLPVVSLLLASGLLSWDAVSRRWGTFIRWGTISLAFVLTILNLFPVGGAKITKILSPRVQHYAYLATPWPHRDVINEIIQTEPYLRSTLGVLPSTPFINQHNLNHYGALRNFQVYGRQVGTRKEQVFQDGRSLSWFLTKTGDQGSVPAEAQANITEFVERGGEFQLHKSWQLIDGSTLKLYHEQQPPIQVQPIAPARTQIELVSVRVPEKVPPGVPVPVTYEWIGPWEQLQSGLVLLTWRSPNSPSRWLHDRAIAMGNLHSEKPAEDSTKSFRVTERLAMLPPANSLPGDYTLSAIYLNRKTGQIYPIPVPNVKLTIDPKAAASPAPELDLLTQLRTIAKELPKGTQGLETVFDVTGRINQYDPIQDYVLQADRTLALRMQMEPQNLEWAYASALARVLRQDVEGAIASLSRVRQLDSENPYAHAYLAFVYLYDWRAKQAETVLKTAISLNPNLPEIQALSGIAALMRGNLFQAWHYLYGSGAL